MKLTKKLWHNFKARPDSWFFYGFLVIFPFSIRKVFFFYPIGGQFNEYTGIYLYLSDIFLILTIALWIISILRNKNDFLSIYRKIFTSTKFFLLAPLSLVIWSFISIGWADNTNIALFRSIKLLEFYLLYLYLIFKIVPRGTFLRHIFQIIIFSGLFHAIFGIWQFIIQKSSGLFWLKESLISRDMIDVANIYLFGNKLIRAYGLFPHPNILGGFLLFSIISTMVYFKLFHVEQNNINKCSTWNNSRFFRVLVIIQFIALLLTFSKSAIFGLLIALLYISVPYWKKCSTPEGMFHPITNVPRGTIASYGAGVEHKRKLVLVTAILVLLVIVIKPDINSLLFKSLEERVIYMQVSPIAQCFTPASTRGDSSMRGGWNNCKTLVYGLGSGQFVLKIDEFVPRGTNLYFWQYQPVHNVFLLIWSELGMIGLVLFIWWIWKLIKIPLTSPFTKGEIQNVPLLSRETRMFHPSQNVPRGTSDGTSVEQASRILKGLLLGFIFIMLFDHYFWDIQQGQILFWLLVGLIAGVSNHNAVDNT